MSEKWSDSRPAEKLLALYTILLVSPEPMSLTLLSKKLDCSKQTVSRLVDQLESSKFGKVIKNRQGKQSIYSLEKPRRQPAVSLNAEGLAQLALCREFLLRLLPPSMSRQMETSLRQASAYLPENSDAMTDGIGASLVKGRIDYRPYENFINTIMKAIAGKKICSVGYRAKRHKEEKNYDFAPVRLIAFHESIFAHGYIVSETGTPRPLYENPNLLALHRFTKCALTRRKADKIPDELPSQSSFLCIMTGEPFDIAVKFSPASATYAAERQWSLDQTIEDLPDGSIILRTKAVNTYECLSWLLSFGDSAEILEPAWLRKHVAEKITAMLGMYKEVANRAG